jgi:hypothetical protein
MRLGNPRRTVMGYNSQPTSPTEFEGSKAWSLLFWSTKVLDNIRKLRETAGGKKSPKQNLNPYNTYCAEKEYRQQRSGS